MKILKEKELKSLSNEDLVNHIKSLSIILSNKENVNNVELDSCQDDDKGKPIVYNKTVIGIDSVTPSGFKYNDMEGNIIGTITFEDAQYLDNKLLLQIAGNYQGTITNEIL